LLSLAPMILPDDDHAPNRVNLRIKKGRKNWMATSRDKEGPWEERRHHQDSWKEEAS
jgi:hypothetical protein